MSVVDLDIDIDLSTNVSTNFTPDQNSAQNSAAVYSNESFETIEMVEMVEVINIIENNRKTNIQNIINPLDSSMISILKLYRKIFFYGLFVSLFTIIFVIIISFLPWVNDLTDYPNYFNSQTITAILCLSLVSFGPVYITYDLFITKEWNIISINDWKKIPITYLVHLLVHIFFWPTFYSLLMSKRIYVWYYYLDFSFFLFGFLPLSIHIAYEIISEKDINFTIKYALSQLFVIVSALGYTFFLFPMFLELSDTYKIIWRLTVHPIWFEITMLLPQRILAAGDKTNTNQYTKFLPVMHSIFHNVTIGRMLLFTLNDIYISLFLITLTNIQEIVLRLTIKWRDDTVSKIFRLKHHDTDNIVHGCVILMEMMLEIVSIFISPIIMAFFMPYGYLFNFNGQIGSSINLSYIISSFFFQLITEVPTDIICMMFEIRSHKIPLHNIWRYIGTKRNIIFCIYGMCTMGILGMLYTTIRLPRLLFCTEHNILTCTYSPI